MPRKTWTGAIVLVACAAALIGLCVSDPFVNGLLVRPLLARFDSRYVSGWTEPVPFDRDLWLTKKARHRVGMAAHLAKSNALKKKTLTELVEMLGEPDLNIPGPDGVRWLLGFRAKGLFDESVWLEVTIGADGTATDAGVGSTWYDPRR